MKEENKRKEKFKMVSKNARLVLYHIVASFVMLTCCRGRGVPEEAVASASPPCT